MKTHTKLAVEMLVRYKGRQGTASARCRRTTRPVSAPRGVRRREPWSVLAVRWPCAADLTQRGLRRPVERTRGPQHLPPSVQAPRSPESTRGSAELRAFAPLTPLPFTKFYPVLWGSVPRSVRSPGALRGAAPAPRSPTGMVPLPHDTWRSDSGPSTRRTRGPRAVVCTPDSPPVPSRVQVHSSRPGGYCLAPAPGRARPSAAGKRRLHHTERTAWRLPRTCLPCVRLARPAHWASLVLGAQGKGLPPGGGGPGRDGRGGTQRGRIIWRRTASPRGLRG